ncbi:MAG: hypothetical protein HY706_17810 [Candidatus Hydrogenedentes bacterium]|nr:hypothetical protein [Candidatus Hydrogenedentota bacterium]
MKLPHGIIVANFLIGAVLVGAAAYLAERWDLGTKLELDLWGARASGTLEPLDGRSYRLSYTHPSGGIYSRRILRPELRMDKERMEIVVAYDATQPDRFQPADISYWPGAFAALLLITGMMFILQGRRKLLRRLRPRPPTTPPDRGGS